MGKSNAEDQYRRSAERGVNALAKDGKMSEKEREETVRAIRNGETFAPTRWSR